MHDDAGDAEEMLSSGLLDRNESVLLVIDVQERYIAHLFEGRGWWRRRGG